jgi:hypothetical protein
MVISAAYREFFSTVATAAAGLTGLLFVAMSVAPRLRPDDGKAVIQQIRAAAALVGFFNALAVPLFGLVPGLSVRYPATVLGIGGILFTAAGTRTIWSSPATAGQRVRQVGLGVLLLLIFGTEFAAGVILLANPSRSTPLELIAAAMVASLLVGVARAWELVGTMDTGIFASLVVLSRHSPGPTPAVGVSDLTTAGGTEDSGTALPSGTLLPKGSVTGGQRPCSLPWPLPWPAGYRRGGGGGPRPAAG